MPAGSSDGEEDEFDVSDADAGEESADDVELP